MIPLPVAPNSPTLFNRSFSSLLALTNQPNTRHNNTDTVNQETTPMQTDNDTSSTPTISVTQETVPMHTDNTPSTQTSNGKKRKYSPSENSEQNAEKKQKKCDSATIIPPAFSSNNIKP